MRVGSEVWFGKRCGSLPGCFHRAIGFRPRDRKSGARRVRYVEDPIRPKTGRSIEELLGSSRHVNLDGFLYLLRLGQYTKTTRYL